MRSAAQRSASQPGVHALGAHHEILAIGRDGSQERFGCGVGVAMNKRVSLLAEDADVHRSRVQIDAAGVLVLTCVESHRGFLHNGCLESPVTLPCG
jgi:hypothetical protein